MKKIITLYLIRHASTNFKKLGYLSYTNVSLSKRGRKETKELAKRLEKYKIDIILSSPLKRAIETAKEISKNKHKVIVICRDLREVNFGVFEGLSRDEAMKKYPKLFEQREKDKWNFRIPGGENYFQAYKRVCRLLRMIENKYENKNVALVTHATIIKLILMHLLKKPLNKIEEFYIKPASFSIIKLVDKKPIIVKWKWKKISK